MTFFLFERALLLSDAVITDKRFMAADAVESTIGCGDCGAEILLSLRHVIGH